MISSLFGSGLAEDEFFEKPVLSIAKDHIVILPGEDLKIKCR